MTPILQSKRTRNPKVKPLASKPRSTRRTADLGRFALDVAGRGALHATAEDEIRRRAYEIFLERGAEAGDELSDWLQAEREVRKSLALSWRMASGRP